MQSVKLLVRQVGVPLPQLDVISADELNEYIDYNFTSIGYELHSTHYLGEVRDTSQNPPAVVGYKTMLWFTKNEDVKAKK